MVTISTSANVVCRHTAFVGVDTETKVPICKLKEEVHDILMDDLSYCMAGAMNLQCCGLDAGSSPSSNLMSYSLGAPVQKKYKKSAGGKLAVVACIYCKSRNFHMGFISAFSQSRTRNVSVRATRMPPRGLQS